MCNYGSKFLTVDMQKLAIFVKCMSHMQHPNLKGVFIMFLQHILPSLVQRVAGQIQRRHWNFLIFKFYKRHIFPQNNLKTP